MIKSVSLPTVLAALCLAAAPALAATPQKLPPSALIPVVPTPTPDSPAGDKSTPAPPSLPGFTAYVLMDAKTGAVLAEAAPTLPVPPASLVKLMTAHLTYQSLRRGTLKPDQTVPVSPAAWHAGGSRMFIDPTSTVTVDQLLHGLIIDSGNDAAVALAQQIAGTQTAFVQLMNQEAARLGLTNTVYTNVTGLPDPSLHTTAMDVALLTRVILQDEPQILEISKQPSYTFNKITQPSWNPVLAHDPTVDGLKTGLTAESGHCIDATAIRNGNRLIAVVMGGPSWQASTAAIESLLNYGQTFFTDVQLATPGAKLGTLSSQALDSGSVDVGPARPVVMTIPADAKGKITTSIAYGGDLTNGVTKGETLGTASFMLGGKTVATVPVVALADSPPASFTTRMKRKLQSIL